MKQCPQQTSNLQHERMSVTEWTTLSNVVSDHFGDEYHSWLLSEDRLVRCSPSKTSREDVGFFQNWCLGVLYIVKLITELNYEPSIASGLYNFSARIELLFRLARG